MCKSKGLLQVPVPNSAVFTLGNNTLNKGILGPVLKKNTVLLKEISVLKVVNFIYLESSLTWDNIFHYTNR